LPWGIVGLAAATLLYTAFTFTLYAAIALKVLGKGVGVLADSLAPGLIGAIIMGLVVCALSHTVLADVTIVNLVLLIVAGAGVYIGWALWLPHKGVRSVREDILADLVSVFRKLGFMGGRRSN
jgi:hypothetical protein